jgi:hypothetical protein
MKLMSEPEQPVHQNGSDGHNALLDAIEKAG